MTSRYRPNGYFQTADKNGRRIEGETRQCVHCGYVWEYVPGSGATRGFCLKCQGLLCNRAECARDQAKLQARFPDRTWSCLPYRDWLERVRDDYDKDTRYEVLPSGIVVERG